MTSFRHPGTVLTDRFFSVPLDHRRPDGEQIEVFAREVVAADKADADLPWLLFLQGGPGFGAQRPEGRESWLDRARYPQDVDQARRVAEYLAEHDVRRPDGAPLPVAAFQSAGAMLGQGGGSHALHYLLEDPFAGDEFSDACRPPRPSAACRPG